MKSRKTRFRRITRILSWSLSLMAAFMLSTTPGRALDDDVFNTLRKIELAAIQIEDHTAELRTILRFPPSTWKRHSLEWIPVQERAKDLAELLGQLQDETFTARMPYWQRTSITRISNRIHALTQATEEAIRFLTQNKNVTVLTSSEEYSNNIVRIRELADQLEDMVEYFKNRSEYEAEMSSS